MKIAFFHKVDEGDQRGFGFNLLRNERTKVAITLIVPFWIKNFKSYFDFCTMSELCGIRLLCISVRLRMRNLKNFKNPELNSLFIFRTGIFWKNFGYQKLIETEEAREDRLYKEHETIKANNI